MLPFLIAVPVLALMAALLLAILLTGCRKAEPPAPRVEASKLPAISVTPKAKLLYTYAATGASFETVPELARVPEGSRGWVRVVDVTLQPDRRLDHELVYVADLREARKDGTFPYVVMSRSAFETAAANRATPGATAPASRPAVGGTPAPAAGGARVTLYSTSWCPACRSARQYLSERKIPFVEKDIEKDQAAAGELLEKARAQGIDASGVPVLDVNGTLMQGFDPAKLNDLLGAKTT